MTAFDWEGLYFREKPAAPPSFPDHIKVHDDLVQGSDEWLAARRGLITASEMKLLLTPTLKVADNDKTRAHLYELAAQRISGHVEPMYVGDDKLRGQEDEYYARCYYSEHIAEVREVGFITNSRHGFTLGYSPDGLVGDDGLVEFKSRRQKFQVQTIIENVGRDGATTIPPEYAIQCQTGLLVAEREWLDFGSYSNGLPMPIIRVYPDERIQSAILDAAAEAEAQIEALIAAYTAALDAGHRVIPTERRIQQEMFT